MLTGICQYSSSRVGCDKRAFQYPTSLQETVVCITYNTMWEFLQPAIQIPWLSRT